MPLSHPGRRTAVRPPRSTGLSAVLVAGVLVLSACGAVSDQGAEPAPTSGIPGLDTLADEPLRDTAPPAVVLAPVEAGPREQVPFALRTPEASGLPEPLVPLSEIVDGGQPPDGIPALDRPTF